MSQEGAVRPAPHQALGIPSNAIIEIKSKHYHGCTRFEVWQVTQPIFVEAPAYTDIVIRDHPVVTLCCSQVGATEPTDSYGKHGFHYVSSVRRDDDGCYRNDLGDEIVIVDQRQPVLAQATLFDAIQTESDIRELEPAPGYVFQPGVNYDAPDCQIWHCSECKRDYNALFAPTVPEMLPGDPRGYRPSCPYCRNRMGIRAIFVLHRGERWNPYLLTLHSRMVQQMIARGAWSQERWCFLGEPAL